ncbi:hypothetical protein [Sulfitobacter guttiformis]|uniref:Uncharacterized protein n=1 Tax=Sulfitobacter guttiformis TaxID=74349 RepID=A0A420DNF3_9RHOB|nr:hypothetical protein [Sulfitobacter guttiformis]KIN73097.1 hypothetical protein Z949_2279 [Sulfitobacter guttiformis KCTC 32187]RKE95782.1 hypothetical protein C8N30_0320 [Sulfitobacter guttiformis]
MLTTLSLLRHTFRLLLKEPLKTLQVVGPALLVLIVISIIASVTSPEIAIGSFEGSRMNAVPLNWIFLTAVVLGYSMMAIAWHRHTLRNTETPRPLTVPLVLGYLWRIVILTTVQITIYVVLMTPLMVSNHSASALNAEPGYISVLMTGFVAELSLIWLSLRLSLILPAAAVGHPMCLTDSWRFTAPVSSQLMGVAAILALVSGVQTAASAHFDLTQPRHLLLLDLPSFVIEGLLIFSLLTILYAALVHKAPLDNTERPTDA